MQKAGLLPKLGAGLMLALPITSMGCNNEAKTPTAQRKLAQKPKLKHLEDTERHFKSLWHSFTGESKPVRVMPDID